jgi:hypothetical protein
MLQLAAFSLHRVSGIEFVKIMLVVLITLGQNVVSDILELSKCSIRYIGIIKNRFFKPSRFLRHTGIYYRALIAIGASVELHCFPIMWPVKYTIDNVSGWDGFFLKY